MIEKRCWHSAVAHLDNIYVLGGCVENFLNTAEVFNTETQQSSLIKPMEIPRQKFAATISGEKIYCLGGFNVRGCTDSIESYNVITRKWKKEKNLPQKKEGFAAVTLYEA